MRSRRFEWVMAGMRSWLLCLFCTLFAAAACGASAEPASPAPIAPPASASAPTPQPGFEWPERHEIFDFVRVVGEPDLEGTQQTCVVVRVGPLADAERWLMPGLEGRVALEVTCMRGEHRDVQAAAISLVLPAGVAAESVVPSTREARADDVETRLRVRVLGLNSGADRVTAELLGMRRIVQSGFMDPTQPPSRCCVERHSRHDDQPAEDPPPPHPGFDFRQWRGRVGTRQLCVVVRMQPPRRANAQERQGSGVDPRVLMRAMCQHARGTSLVNLYFDAHRASRAQYVEPGVFVRGRITHGGDLRVEGVSPTPAKYRRSIRR